MTREQQETSATRKRCKMKQHEKYARDIQLLRSHKITKIWIRPSPLACTYSILVTPPLNKSPLFSWNHFSFERE